MEAAARLSLGRVSVMQNYTLTEAEQRSGAQAGQPLVDTPRHMYNAQLRAAVSKVLSTWLRVEARSSRTRRISTAAIAATEQTGAFQGLWLDAPRRCLQAELDADGQRDRLQPARHRLPELRALRLEQRGAYASEFNNLQEPRRLWLWLSYAF